MTYIIESKEGYVHKFDSVMGMKAAVITSDRMLHSNILRDLRYGYTSILKMTFYYSGKRSDVQKLEQKGAQNKNVENILN